MRAGRTAGSSLGPAGAGPHLHQNPAHHKRLTIGLYAGAVSEPWFGGITNEAQLSGHQGAFLDECRQMLEYSSDRVPVQLRTSARLESCRGGEQLVLELSEVDGDLIIEAFVSDDEIIMAMSETDAWSDHWHFAPTWNDVYGPLPDRPWRSLAVDFLAELLGAEVRVRATYRGDSPIKVHTEVITSDGESLTDCTTGALTPSVLKFWLKRRVEDRTVRLGRS